MHHIKLGLIHIIRTLYISSIRLRIENLFLRVRSSHVRCRSGGLRSSKCFSWQGWVRKKNIHLSKNIFVSTGLDIWLTSFTFTSELFYIDFSKRGWPWPSSSSSSSSSWPWPWDIENKDFYQRTMKGFSSTEVRLNHSNLYFLPESPKNIFLVL